MKYKKTYFDSGAEYKKKDGLYSIKEKLFSDKKSKEHYNFILKERWVNLKGCKKILDIGCGKCEFLKLNPYGAEIFGTDIIPETLKEAKEQGINVNLGDVNKKLPYKNNFFDGIILSHVIEHIEDPANMFDEIKRISKNDCKLVIVVPNCSFKEFYNDYTHKHPYTKMSLYRILKDNGFKDIKIENGPCLNPLLGILLLFPKLRLLIEKIFGKISPSEFIAVAKYEK